MIRYSLGHGVAGFVVFSVILVGVLNSQTALEVIKSSNQEILDLYRRHDRIDSSVKEQMVRIIEKVTDTEKISHDIIEKSCLRFDTDQCRELDNICRRLLRLSVLGKLGRFRAGRFEYMGEEISDKSAVVRTRVYDQSDSVAIDYRLELREDGWKIVNYFTDGIDTVRNYRKQFSRLFARYPYETAMNRLRRKIGKLEEENR